MAVSREFCSKCGAKLEPGAKFCVSCGAKITDQVGVGITPPRRSVPPPPPPARSPSPPPVAKAAHRPPPPPPRREAPPPPRSQPIPEPQVEPISATPTTAVGGVGTLFGNIIVLAIAWAIGWGVGDAISYGYAVGFDNALSSLSSGDMDAYSIEKFFLNAIAGTVSGALAGLLISILFFGASAGGTPRILFTILFWIGLDVVTVQFWEELGIHSLEDFMGWTGILGLIFGLIFSITLLFQKSRLAFFRVPLGAAVFAFAAAVGRMVQFEML